MYFKCIRGHFFKVLKMNCGNIYLVTSKEQQYVICVELHYEVALNDGCDEPGFKVDYSFTGLS